MKDDNFYIDLVASLNVFGHNCNTKLVYPQQLLNISPFSLANLTLMDQLILRTLYFKGEQTMSGMARLLNIKLPLLSRIADRLVKKNCIKRVPKKGDRRSYYIALTNLGLDLTHQHIKNYKNYVYNRLKSNLTIDELKKLKQGLDFLYWAFGEYSKNWSDNDNR